GGGESTPKPLRRGMRIPNRIVDTVRDIARWGGEHDPFVRFTARRSTVALATTHETATRLRNIGAEHIELHPNVGISDSEIEQLSADAPKKLAPVTFLSVGRLIPYKG